MPAYRTPTPQQPQVSVVFRDPGDRIDAIRDYTHLLACGLRQEGATADVTLLKSAVVPQPSQATDVLLINYNPFAWGRWGWAPALPCSLARMRASETRPLIGVIVHEPAVPWKGFRQTLMAAWQRTQLAATLRVADLALVSIEPWVPVMRRWAGSSTPIHHLPVGSNLPDMRGARSDQRTKLGLDSDTLVLAMFGGRHPSRPAEHLRQGIKAASRGGRRLVVLNLGADPPNLPELNGGGEMVTPGPLPPVEIARLLSAADLFIGPFTDGASSRRGSLVAALQHGLPTVSTAGPLTDPFLHRSSALVLVPGQDPTAFGDAVAHLADHSEERHALGLRARKLFDERLDWRIIARRLLGLVAAGGKEQPPP